MFNLALTVLFLFGVTLVLSGAQILVAANDMRVKNLDHFILVIISLALIIAGSITAYLPLLEILNHLQVII